jgi:hypothetical protein
VAALHGAHARVQLVEIEGLDEVVVGAGIQARHAVAAPSRAVSTITGVASRTAAQPAQHVMPPPPPPLPGVPPGGQAQVEQHQVEALAAKRRPRGRRVAHPVDRIPSRRSALRRHVADHAVVFDEQQPHAESGRVVQPGRRLRRARNRRRGAICAR